MERGVQTELGIGDFIYLFLPSSYLISASCSPRRAGGDIKWRRMQSLWSGAMFGAQVLPMASEVLPVGNTALMSIVVEGTTAAYTVCSCARARREKPCHM